MLSFARNHLVPQWLKNKVNPITEIHIEQIENTQKQLIKWAAKNKQAMLMFAPRKMSYVKYVLTRVENPIGLHVHICDDMDCDPLPLPSFSEQKTKIREGLDFLTDLNLETTDFASGHWSYNYDTFRACKQLGLTDVHLRCIHIPNLTCGVIEGIRLIPVHKHLHDYTLLVGKNCISLL